MTKFERQVAKGCVFGAIFGGGVHEMSMRLKIAEKQAQAYLDTFFNTFPKISDYIDRQHRIVKQNGIIRTILGRPRKFVDKNTSEASREAANHTIQAVGADILLLSAMRISKKLKDDGLLNKQIFLMNLIHDNIMADVRRAYLKYAIDEGVAAMSGVPKLLGFKIDFPVDVKIGRRWGESLDIKDILK